MTFSKIGSLKLRQDPSEQKESYSQSILAPK